MYSVQHLRGLSNTLAAGVLLGGVDNGKACLSLSAAILTMDSRSKSQGKGLHTGRKGLLQLLGLVAVLEDKGVEVVAAADLELDLLVGVLLHAHSCKNRSISQMFTITPPMLLIESSVHTCVLRKCARPVSPSKFLLFLRSSIPPAPGQNVQEASLRRQISMKLLMSEISRGMLAVLFDWVRSGYTGDSSIRVYLDRPLQFECGGGGSPRGTSAR